MTQFSRERMREYMRNYYHTPEGKKKMDANSKAYQKTDKYKAYQKAYRKTDKYKAYMKAYYHKNRARILARMKEARK